MVQMEQVYSTLRSSFSDNEPIFLSSISVPGVKEPVLRQYIRQLNLKGMINRFDTGIYYFPKPTIFKSGSTLSLLDVIEKKYLLDGKDPIGYVSGLLFANKVGLTTQVPSVYEICSNKASTAYREVRIANQTIILRRPCTEVTSENVRVLQFLDLLKDLSDVSEMEGEDRNAAVLSYAKDNAIDFPSMAEFLKFYPDRIYRNMYEVGLLLGASI